MQIFDRLKSWSDSRGITSQELPNDINWSTQHTNLSIFYEMMKNKGVTGYVLNKLEELVEYAEAMSNHDLDGAIDAIADSSVFDATELCKMGLEPELVMNEVLMVVESRTGKWDDELGKFVKDKSPEAQAKWYTPKYLGKCETKVCRTPSLFGFDKQNSSRYEDATK